MEEETRTAFAHSSDIKSQVQDESSAAGSSTLMRTNKTAVVGKLADNIGGTPTRTLATELPQDNSKKECQVYPGSAELTSQSSRAHLLSQNIPKSVEDQTSDVDIEAEIVHFLSSARHRIFETYTELQRLEETLIKSKHRLNRHNLLEDTITFKTAAWQAAQDDDVQSVWGHLSLVERLLGDAIARTRVLRERLP